MFGPTGLLTLTHGTFFRRKTYLRHLVPIRLQGKDYIQQKKQVITCMKRGDLFIFIKYFYTQRFSSYNSICSVIPENPQWLLIPHSWPEAAEGSISSPVLLLSPAYLLPCRPYGAFSHSPSLSAFLSPHPLILFKDITC